MSGLPRDTALLAVHAINPHGFAWLRRVTEENCDLNRNFVDFTKPLPANPGYDELAAEWLPAELQGPEYERAEARIREYRLKHGDKAYMEARSAGQWKHAHGFFYGGAAPTWARRTLEAIIADQNLPGRRCVAVIEKLSFGGDSTDPIRIAAYVSKDNQVKLRYKLTRPLPSTLLQLDYAIISYDEDSKTWYTSLALDTPPSDAQLNTADGALQQQPAGAA